jgi:uncharacterized protein YbaR (Trm112 family)
VAVQEGFNTLRQLIREGRSLFRERPLHSAMPPPAGAGLVLDVGGGDRPHPRADLVVDKYVTDNFERERDIAFTKPLVVADGEELPLADGSFAYLIASHVLEHAIDPNRMAGEFSRVAGAGFVQLPTAFSERHFGWPFHPWFVDREDETLVFRPKTKHEGADEGLHEAYSESLLFRLAWAAHRSRWHHSVHWRGRLDVRAPKLEKQEHERSSIELDRTLSVLETMGRSGSVVSLDERLQALLRCPAADCRGQIVLRNDEAACQSCETRYPAPGGVPVLLREAGSPAR